MRCAASSVVTQINETKHEIGQCPPPPPASHWRNKKGRTNSIFNFRKRVGDVAATLISSGSYIYVRNKELRVGDFISSIATGRLPEENKKEKLLAKRIVVARNTENSQLKLNWVEISRYIRPTQQQPAARRRYRQHLPSPPKRTGPFRPSSKSSHCAPYPKCSQID